MREEERERGVRIGVEGHVIPCAYDSPTLRSHFSITMWVLGIELRRSGRAKPLYQPSVSPALKAEFEGRFNLCFFNPITKKHHTSP